MTSGCADRTWLEAVAIERMRPEDLGEVLAIEHVSFPSAWSEESYRRELRNPSGHYFVARLGAAIVGYAGMWIVAEEAHISTLAVHPQRRRCGLGERLIAHLISTAQQYGAELMTLEVREGNLAAQALYVKLGFQASGLRPRYYGDTGENAILMSRSVGASPQP